MSNPPCTNCNGNILNQSASLIANPLCVGDCPQNVACTDVLASDCVYYNGSTLSCISFNGRPVQNGDSLSTILHTINNSYGTRVSASDTCCGFLNTKIVSGNPSLLSITTQTLSGCQTLVLTPSGNSQTCVGQVKVDGTDNCGYLYNKVSSTDNSITLTNNAGTTGKLDLSVPCASKVKISAVDTTCGYLQDKILSGALYPEVTNPTGNATISFKKQILTVRFRPSIINNDAPCGSNQGSIVDGRHNQNWTGVGTVVDWSGPGTPPSYDSAQGTIYIPAGTWNLTISGQLGFGDNTTLRSGYLILGLTEGGNVYLQSMAGMFCQHQQVLLFSGFNNNFTFTNAVNLNFTTYSTLTNGSGAGISFTPSTNDVILISIEKSA
jgi:hypothetical protein